MNTELVRKIRNMMRQMQRARETAPVDSWWRLGSHDTGTHARVMAHAAAWNDEEDAFSGPIMVVLQCGPVVMIIEPKHLIAKWTSLDENRPAGPT